MKTLVLIRHAKAEPADSEPRDEERPLAEKGRGDADALGHYLAARGDSPQLALCSSSLRTVETLERVRGALAESARIEIDDSLYLASAGELLARLCAIGPTVSGALLVGHNPAIQQLACTLAIAGDRDARERMARKFAPGACAVIEFDVADWRDVSTGGCLIAFQRPKDFAR
jgi:phosphohistidine phosphatase